MINLCIPMEHAWIEYRNQIVDPTWFCVPEWHDTNAIYRVFRQFELNNIGLIDETPNSIAWFKTADEYMQAINEMIEKCQKLNS
jgi:hypothetical protein